MFHEKGRQAAWNSFQLTLILHKSNSQSSNCEIFVYNWINWWNFYSFNIWILQNKAYSEKSRVTSTAGFPKWGLLQVFRGNIYIEDT